MKKRFFCTAMTILLFNNLYACSSSTTYVGKDSRVFANGEKKVRYSDGEIEFYYPDSFNVSWSESFIFRAEKNDSKDFTNFIIIYRLAGDVIPHDYISNYLVMKQGQNSYTNETGEFEFNNGNSVDKAFYGKIYNNEKGSSQYFTTVLYQSCAEMNNYFVLCIQINNEVFSEEITNEIIRSFKILENSVTQEEDSD